MNSVTNKPIPIGILTLALATNSACPDLIHRWSFDEPAGNAIDGATFADSVGGADGAVSLHEPLSGRILSPIPAATARSIARRAWVGPQTSIHAARLVDESVGTEFRGPFPAWQITYNDVANTRVYVDASSGAVLSARSDTWRFFDFIWGLHIMDWTQRDRINSWWLLLFGIGGTIIAISGFVLLANRFPRMKRRARRGQVAR